MHSNKIFIISIISYLWNQICTLIFIFLMLIHVILSPRLSRLIITRGCSRKCHARLWHRKITLIEFRNYSQYSPSLENEETFLKNSRRSEVLICALCLLYKNLSQTSNSDVWNAFLTRFVINFYFIKGHQSISIPFLDGKRHETETLRANCKNQLTFSKG